MAPPPVTTAPSSEPQTPSTSSDSGHKRSVLERLLGAPLTCSQGLLITLALADSLSTLSLYIPYTHLPSAVQVTSDDMTLTS